MLIIKGAKAPKKDTKNMPLRRDILRYKASIKKVVAKENIALTDKIALPALWLIPVDSIKGRYTVKILLQRPRLHIYNNKQAKHIAHA